MESREGVSRSHRIRRAARLLILGVVLLTLWVTFRPWICAAELDIVEKNAADGQLERCVDCLASSGTRGLSAIEWVLERKAWSGSVYLPPDVGVLTEALRRVGEPAHRRLLTDLDEASDSSSRLAYLYFLQMAFGDFSRMGLWPEILQRSPGQGFLLQGTLIAHFGASVPDVVNYPVLNPRFLRWYRSMSGPREPLPPVPAFGSSST